MKKIIITSIITLFIIGCSSDKKTLHVFAWSDYFSPELIQLFEQQNNCNVVIDAFDSNEAAYAKLKLGATGYDIVIPSTYQIPLLVKDKIIQPLNHEYLPNVIKNYNHMLDSQIVDKEFNWSVPYACTYTGLMYLKDQVDDLRSWEVINNPKYKGRVSLLDDIREVIGVGLMHNGHSLNSTNEQEIIEAAKTICSWKSNVRKFDAESYKLEVANKSSTIGHGYSSDAMQIILEGRDDIGFALPDEGFTIAWDEFVVTKDTQNYELAHKFIDFFYEDDNAYQNMLYICALTGNKNAFEKLSPEYKKIMFPDNISKGQLLKGIDDANVLETYNKAWDMIKAISK